MPPTIGRWICFSSCSPPENAKNSHLQMLARLAQTLSDPDFVAGLRAAKNAEEAARIIEDAEGSPRAAANG